MTIIEPQIVYHYCSVDTFIKIIESKELWFANALTTNDSKEIIQSKKVIYEMLDMARDSIRREPEKNHEMLRRTTFDQSYDGYMTLEKLKDFYSSCNLSMETLNQHYRERFESIRNAGESEFITVEALQKYLTDQVEKIINSFEDIYYSSILGNGYPHICCFSYEGDLLSQWRAYADDGKGVAIGFDSSQLETAITNRYRFSEASRVRYNNKEHHNLFWGPFNELMLFLTTDFPRQSSDGDQVHRDIFRTILSFSCFIKTEGFQEEKEWRMVLFSCPAHHKIVGGSADDDRPKMKYRYNGLDICSYFSVPFEPPDAQSHAITEIIMGPNCTITSLSTMNLMRNYNGSFTLGQIKYSNTSYRTK